jgi:hypothetical protein
MRSPAWARFALLAGLVLTMGASCSVATRRTVTTDTNWSLFVVPGPTDEGNAAETFCDNNGRAVVRVSDYDKLSRTEMRAIWEHERHHVEDLQADPKKSCDQNAFEQWGSPARYAFAEARAYCAEMKYRHNKTDQKGDFLLGYMRAAQAVAKDIMDEQSFWKVKENVGPEVVVLFIRVCPFVTVVEPRR